MSDTANKSSSGDLELPWKGLVIQMGSRKLNSFPAGTFLVGKKELRPPLPSSLTLLETPRYWNQGRGNLPSFWFTHNRTCSRSSSLNSTFPSSLKAGKMTDTLSTERDTQKKGALCWWFTVWGRLRDGLASPPCSVSPLLTTSTAVSRSPSAPSHTQVTILCCEAQQFSIHSYRHHSPCLTRSTVQQSSTHNITQTSPSAINPSSSRFGLPESDPASASMTRAARPPSVPFWESLSKEGNSLGCHMAFLWGGQKHHPA